MRICQYRSNGIHQVLFWIQWFYYRNKLTNHLEHKPGVITEVDWSGPTMSYVDTSTGEIVTVYLFVGTLPYSQYSYVEPTRDMKMDSFIRCHIHMYEFFGGVTTRLVCCYISPLPLFIDNLHINLLHPIHYNLILINIWKQFYIHILNISNNAIFKIYHDCIHFFRGNCNIHNFIIMI